MKHACELWDEARNLQLLRLLQDVDEGVTDAADYEFLVNLFVMYIPFGPTMQTPEAVHRWVQNNLIPPATELPNETAVENGGATWRD